MNTWGTKYKWVFIAAFSVMFILPFQNCAQNLDEQEGNLFLRSGSSRSRDCLSELVDCGPERAFLGILLDLADPRVLPTNASSLEAFGRCNDGNFPSHFIRVEIIEPGQGILNSVDVADACVNGLFDIELSLAGVSPNARYTLRVQILGFFDQQTFTGTSSDGQDQIDFSLQDI